MILKNMAGNIENAISLFSKEIQGIQCTEATVQSLFYHCLLSSGFTAKQVCLELMSDMGSLERADVAIFSDLYNGNFSLFHNADKCQPNDQIKRREIQALFEIKGGYHKTKTAIGKLDIWLRLYKDGQSNKSNPLSDIDKLVRWREVFPNLDYLGFVAVEFPEIRDINNENAVVEVGNICVSKGINFIYINSQTGFYKVYSP
ncbi:MAG: hypothetical protein D6732_27075 [Methanobacteriota archaeon]|nr:MAG: hypothetical protein D6732_27075 [Euryarchaeota archaeon]